MSTVTAQLDDFFYSVYEDLLVRGIARVI